METEGRGVSSGFVSTCPPAVRGLAPSSGPSLASGERPLVLTWGPTGPEKSRESAIEAFGQLADLDPSPRFLIAGATHRHVEENAGERYRGTLIALARNLGLEDVGEFADRYLEKRALARLIRSADVVLLPDVSTEQVMSGVPDEWATVIEGGGARLEACHVGG